MELSEEAWVQTGTRADTHDSNSPVQWTPITVKRLLSASTWMQLVTDYTALVTSSDFDGEFAFTIEDSGKPLFSIQTRNVAVRVSPNMALVLGLVDPVVLPNSVVEGCG